MGYRNYIGFIPKKEYNKIKNLSKEELYALKNEDLEDGYVSPNDFITELYNFGKYCDFETKGYVKPFFKNKEHQKIHTEDTELYIVQKEFFEQIILNYEEKIKKYYTEMLSPFKGFNDSEMIKSVKHDYSYKNDKITYTFDVTKVTPEEQTSIIEMINHIRSMSMEWTHLKPYNLNDGNEITTSWKYEYAQFELVRIYKTFDWKKNVMVYYGW